MISGIEVMDLNGKYPSGNISIWELDVPTNRILINQFFEGEKLVIPGKALRIAIRPGKYWDKKNAFEFSLQALVYMMRVQQAVVRIFIKIDVDRILDG